MKEEKTGKLKLAIVLGTSLINGRGYEQFVMDFSKNVDRENIDLKVLQTDVVNTVQTTVDEIERKVGRDRIITVSGRANRFRSSIFGRIRKIPLGKVFEAAIIAPIIITLLRRTIYKESLNQIRNFDAVYLVDNEDYHLVKSFKLSIIGSAIGMFENPDSYYTRIIVALIQSRLIYRKMSAIHLFPAHYGNISKKLGAKNLLIQPLGVDSTVFKPDDSITRSKTIKFLYVGQLENWKGSQDAVDAFLKINDRIDCELNIVGSGPLYSEFEKINCHEIILHGSIERSYLSRLYQQCDVFLYPSHGETYGLVVMEALSSGMFCLVGKNLKGNFDDFVNRKYIEYLDYEINHISQKMLECAKRLNEIRANKNTVHEYVSANYDWSVVANNMVQFFNKIAVSNSRDSETISST